ncbi:MAG: hypothetical protein ABR616_10885 [Dermatophilaceae bacterium]|nr:hypothetical protein [Intrasporangiaceae bacterium]
MAEQTKLFPDDVGTEGRAPGDRERREYRSGLGRNTPVRRWRQRTQAFEAGVRPEPMGFGGLDNPNPDGPVNPVDRDIVPMAGDAAQDSYWSENIHPGSEAARNRAAMANLDIPQPQGPLQWPREYSQEFVEPRSLSTVQFEGVDARHVDRARGANTEIPDIRIEEHAGESVVVDGNHRTAAALADGALFMGAEVARPKMGPHRVLSDEEGYRYYEER